MRKKLTGLFCALMLLTFASITMVSAATPEVLLDWTLDDSVSPYNAWLHIQRTDIGGGIWHWEYWMDNGTTEPLKQFSVGFLADPTGHISNFQYFLEGALTPASTTPTSSNLLWVFTANPVPLDATFGPRQQASFSFDTDWQYVTLANHQARDGVVTPQWVARATPAPSIPEPMSLILGGLGMATVAGFRKLRVVK